MYLTHPKDFHSFASRNPMEFTVYLKGTTLVAVVAVLSVCTVQSAVINARYDPDDPKLLHENTIAPPTTAPTKPTTTSTKPTYPPGHFCKLHKKEFVFTTRGCKSNVTEQIKVCTGMDPSHQRTSYTVPYKYSLSLRCVPTRSVIKHKKLVFTDCEGPIKNRTIKVYMHIIKNCTETFNN